METQNAAEMPRYKSHKRVWALKIKEIAPTFTEVTDTREQVQTGAWIFPEESGYAQFHVGQDYITKTCSESRRLLRRLCGWLQELESGTSF